MMPLPTRSNSSAQTSNRIGRFYLVREIGRGSVGTVYVARDPVIDRNVAIKISSVRANPAEKKQFDQQLINEARAAGRLNHPNIVTIFDAGSENGSSYIAMEYLQGSVLGKRMDSGEKFTPETVAAIGLKLADALGHAHKNGVIHRDVNPANIFLSDDSEPKIFDFGIARAPNRLQDAQEEEDQPYTLFRNNLLGTPNYMSPEQATGRPADHLTDVYSLGAVMYEMLAQRKPFQSETTEALLEAIAYKAPQAPHEFNPAVPAGLSQIVMKAMSKRAEKRYQSATEMAQDIQRYLNLGKLHAKVAVAATAEIETVESEAPRSRTHLAVIGAVLAVALAAGGYFWLH
ncbi:MAG TPA: serine/threonine-protein kinase [Burkholderiaceae bacterium]|jgi:serine/threonine-protein kinase